MADFAPAHPSEELLEDFLKPFAMVVHGKRAITPDTTLRLARYLKMSPELWMGMQTTYDLQFAREQVGARWDEGSSASGRICAPIGYSTSSLPSRPDEAAESIRLSSMVSALTRGTRWLSDA